MSATKPPAQTIGKWLRDNGHSLGALTGQDWRALRAAVQVADLWLNADYEGQTQAAIAFNACVRSMQRSTWYLAFHSIAHVGDWSHRITLWNAAQMPPLIHIPRCTHERSFVEFAAP